MDIMEEKLPIGPEEVAEAAAVLQKYKAGKAALDKRLVDNELWFRMGHWKNYQNPMMEGKPQPSSGWLFNSIANKHADAMDNYPAPNVLPRAADDEQTARVLSSILPVVLEQADYEQVYSDTWWRKLKQGTGVKGIFWDPEAHGGLGEIAIRPMNLLMLYWEPGVEDIQTSPNFFSLRMENTRQLETRWPQLKGHSASVLDVPRFLHDGGLDTTEKSVVVDWYYKKPDAEGRVLLHYCKFCNGVVLYASENDPALAGRGFYDHGSVAQQAYQQQIGALNQAIPTLYQLALDTYDSGGDALVSQLDQLNTQEQNAQGLYQQKLSDYYTRLEQLGNAYNTAYQQDYGQYQDYLSRLDTLYGNYAAQEQEAAARKQQRFNNAVTVLGLIGDAVQIALSGTTGLGSLAGSLVNTGYNIYANNRAYEADRADMAWNQQMQEKQVQNAQAQQKYDNDFAQQQYQDKLRQQQFNNQVTSEKLNIAKGEWALKQSKAAQQARKASAAAAQRAAAAGASGTSGPGSGNLNVGKSGVLGSTAVPYTAARLRSQGRSDAAIRTELLKEGYSSKEVGEIMKQLNS